MTTPPPAFFTPDGDHFVPGDLARGPWGSTIGGNMIGGILGHIVENAVENAVTESDWQPARLTVDLLRPAALAPVRGRASIIRRGKRLTLVEAELLQADTVVARASGLFLRGSEQPSGEVWTSPLVMPPLPPQSVAPTGVPLVIWAYGKMADAAGASFDLTQWQHDGPKFVWVRDLAPLIEGIPTTPFVRASMAGDVASSLTHYGTTGLNYINADFTLGLSRLPEGDDVGLAALTYSGHDGIATGTAAIFDRRGQIGTATATTLANPGFSPPSMG